MASDTLMDISTLWVFICAILVLFMQAGFTCLESGLTRNKNSINVAMKNIADMGVSISLYWLFGFAIMFGSSIGGIVGSGMIGFEPKSPGEYKLVAFFFYQVMFAATAITIVSGAIAERVRFLGYILLSAFIGLTIYPIVGHWIWNGIEIGQYNGWLGKLGMRDFAGSTVVHSVGGWIALAVLRIIGPRLGRFPEGGPPQEIPGSNIPIAILGALILMMGWLGFNGGSTLQFNRSVSIVLLNTAIAPAGGMAAGLFISTFRYGQATVSSVMNGLLSGLVAITACSSMVSAREAFFIGAVGSLFMMAAEKLLERLKIDDAVGAIPVHLAAGIWGTLAVALFGDLSFFNEGVTRGEQFMIQLLGAAAVGIYSFAAATLVVKAVNFFYPIRISPEGEMIGLNISEHNAATENYNLIKAMEKQAITGDMSMRLHADSFTEAGQIAARYNRVLDRVTVETKLAERMAELATIAKKKMELASIELKRKVDELDAFKRMAVGRELRMIELKREINSLLESKGEPPRFEMSELEEGKENQ